jgi:hypothetical protein
MYSNLYRGLVVGLMFGIGFTPVAETSAAKKPLPKIDVKSLSEAEQTKLALSAAPAPHCQRGGRHDLGGRGDAD